MFWIIVAVATWGIVHSWLASFGVKGYVRRTLGESIFRFYRLAYNLFSVISLIPILVLVRLLPDQGLYAIQPPWLYLMFAGQALGLALLVAAVLQTDTASFIGLRQPFQGERPGALVTGGFYGWVRHPLYLFGLLIMWLTPVMTLNMLVVYIALTVYLMVGAMFEERKLAREFGAEYKAYKARTPMILPSPVRRRPHP